MNAYLTIDDAPSETLGAKLDALDAHDVPAVLFCEGRRLDDYPALAERAVEAGYHLGNHTYSHPYASDSSVEAFEQELARTERRIDAVYDRTSVTRPARLFRFPYGDDGGDHAELFQQILDDYGFTGPNGAATGERPRFDWSWTLDAEDWETDDVAELRARFETALSEAGDGDEIVLFHDAGNSPELFEAFVGWLDDSDLDLADPLDLIR
ncbi:polysaccharide deacetylase family protein [Halobacterium noricense]|uniref:polysaccharide deacetylase family protein n=1 Tax=Halobacterium noricense TaxID=223182 RepID=UPI001E466F71|nr:polysaccharide deacetylase family protein [Halobacterium noricense]UHH23928.1 polysaccharide deacetylase family protein [Halobacterium noricense]